jgi:DMSO/TMAO reductase YedYZ molybdopterin-dependent catalytic subunit
VSRAIGRRAFLGGLAGAAGLLVLGDGLPRALRTWLEAPLGELSPGDGFHFYSVTGSIPAWDRKSWRLTVDGQVQRPLRLGLDQLAALPQAEVRADFHCVSGWSVAAVHWQGVRLGEVVARARPLAQARALRFESADGAYVDDLDLATAARPSVLLALGMNGSPLRPERGAPVRLLVPFYYGYKSVKWLRRISLVASPGTGYWEARGYDPDARIRD